MQIFTVYSIGINADIFQEKYALYIVDRMPSYFDGVEFTFRAPAEIRAEIAELADNGIEIIN